MDRQGLTQHQINDLTKRFQIKPMGDKFSALGVAPWKFNKDIGFEFNRTPWRAVSIADNSYAGCGVAPAANRFGNYGRDDPDYERADVKILLVGASFTMVGDKGGHLVNELVAQELSRRTGVSPELLRAWERRYGLLQPVRSAGGLRLYSTSDVRLRKS